MAWMVPSVAADYMGWPVDDVLAAIRGGTVASRVEGGFLLVGVGEPLEVDPVVVPVDEPAMSITMGDWREGRRVACSGRLPPAMRQAA